MSRKIIQICAVPGFRGSLEMVVALCDDGSVWCHPDGMEWRRLADIPQPEPETRHAQYEQLLKPVYTDEADF